MQQNPNISKQECCTPNPASHYNGGNSTSSFKRLIVCCDGTWTSSDEGPPQRPSNVTRFARALNFVDDGNGKDIEQIVCYQGGIGTSQMLPLQHLLEGVFAYGLDDNVREAYAFLCANYQKRPANSPSDEIFLFGFSRGSYVARAVAGLISDIGLLTKRGLDDFSLIYDQYSKGPESFAIFRENRIIDNDGGSPWESQTDVTIKVIGCFETVGSVGFPNTWFSRLLHLNKNFGFYDTMLEKGVENAFHALSLDERRRGFVPTLWYLPKERKNINLVQCWFPGVHSNIGGGSYEDHSLADITLAWMIDRCSPFLKFDSSYVDQICVDSRMAYTDRPVDWITKIEESFQRMFRKTVEKSSRYADGEIPDSWAVFPYYLQVPKGRTPGQYDLPGITNEYFHASVRVRYLNDPKWAQSCYALRGVKMCNYDNGKYQWLVEKTQFMLDEEAFGNFSSKGIALQNGAEGTLAAQFGGV